MVGLLECGGEGMGLSNEALGKQGGGGGVSEEQDRRAHPRLHCKGGAEIHVYPERVRTLGAVSNLSVSGCSIEADKKMPMLPHERVEVHLHLNGLTLQVAGVVRHMENNERVGIEFTDVSKRKAKQIEQLIGEIVEDGEAG